MSKGEGKDQTSPKEEEQQQQKKARLSSFHLYSIQATSLLVGATYIQGESSVFSV